MDDDMPVLQSIDELAALVELRDDLRSLPEHDEYATVQDVWNAVAS